MTYPCKRFLLHDPCQQPTSAVVSTRTYAYWQWQIEKYIMKKLKTTRQWYFTHLPGCSHWGDRFEFWLAGSYRRRNHPCQILWQSVQGFWSSDTPNFALLHRNSWSPLQQCKHYRATLWFKGSAIGMHTNHHHSIFKQAVATNGVLHKPQTLQYSVVF